MIWCQKSIRLHVLITIIAPVFTIPIDNGVTSTEVTCTEDAITVTFGTQNPFTGRIFVKGMSDNPDCIQSFTDAGNTVGPEINFSFGNCNMQRTRQLTPQKGMMQSIVVIISFHRMFITKVDRAYKVQCFYMEADKTVSAQLDVSMITTDDIQDTGRMPTCTYTVRMGATNGLPVQYAKVGDKVYHTWLCDSDTHRILIRNCYVDDGQGNKFETVDERGCAIDPVIMADLTYDREGMAKAYVEAHVFKYADRPTLYFKCTVQICNRGEDTCDAISPPNCSRRRFSPRRRLSQENAVDSDRRPTVVDDRVEPSPSPSTSSSTAHHYVTTRDISRGTESANSTRQTTPVSAREPTGGALSTDPLESLWSSRSPAVLGPLAERNAPQNAAAARSRPGISRLGRETQPFTTPRLQNTDPAEFGNLATFENPRYDDQYGGNNERQPPHVPLPSDQPGITDFERRLRNEANVAPEERYQSNHEALTIINGPVTNQNMSYEPPAVPDIPDEQMETTWSPYIFKLEKRSVDIIQKMGPSENEIFYEPLRSEEIDLVSNSISVLDLDEAISDFQADRLFDSSVFDDSGISADEASDKVCMSPVGFGLLVSLVLVVFVVIFLITCLLCYGRRRRRYAKS